MTGPVAGGQAASGGVGATVDALAAELIALYTRAEQQLLRDLSTIAARNLDQAAGVARLVMLGEMRQAAMRVATALTARAEPLTGQITREAAQRGDAAANAQLRRLVEGDSRLARGYLGRAGEASGHGLAAANQIALELSAGLGSLRTGILRAADDAYRSIVADAATALVLGNRGLTPHAAQAVAFRRFYDEAVPRFVDKAGRRWSMASYTEMAVRTATQRAYNAAHQQRMLAVGIRYFTVPADGHPCPLCRPWEGAVLSVGRVGTVVEPAADSDRPVAFTVKATVADATAAGLFHPNCRHTLQAYLPGVTKTRPAAPWSQADQARYNATERLRELERKVRKAKQDEAIAVGLRDEQRYGQARARQRRYQAQIRDHVAAHGLVRRPHRERPDLGYTTPPSTGAPA